MLKKIKNFLSRAKETVKQVVTPVVAAVVAVVGGVAPSHAALDLTGVTVDTAPVFSLASLLLVAMGGIWAIKKVIKLMNRS